MRLPPFITENGPVWEVRFKRKADRPEHEIVAR